LCRTDGEIAKPGVKHRVVKSKNPSRQSSTGLIVRTHFGGIFNAPTIYSDQIGAAASKAAKLPAKPLIVNAKRLKIRDVCPTSG
jgi:hypothetical protein